MKTGIIPLNHPAMSRTTQHCHEHKYFDIFQKICQDKAIQGSKKQNK